MTNIVTLPHWSTFVRCEPRCEGAAIAFGDDWPGVWIRGDTAALYACAVSKALTALTAGDKLPALTPLQRNADLIQRGVLEGLLSDLNSCNLNLRGKEDAGPES